MNAIIAGSLLYIVSGIATAVLVLIVDDEPKSEDLFLVTIPVLFWPLFLVIYLPVFIARRIRQWAERKPIPDSEEFD